MNKILKKYTTIPDELYVRRSADEQLESIIKDMQRPGYVLVSRQMGKTNLLLNAKRTLTNDNRYFAYIDLSNLYSTEIECFRGIIDDIVLPNDDLQQSVYSNILIIREKDFPPHVEYLRSLILILKTLNKDLVIILDEIDALKSVNFSDNIFAQIRSTYFQRISYPELHNVTYVLSGVIEPSELIKDKNKSPFNIGEKIYLNDFSLEETKEFNVKSKMNLDIQIIEHLYEWTSGNPRINYELFSELEDYDKKEINIDLLNKIIKEKYLIKYDLPPIDHIRELVKTNDDIINFLKEYYYGNKLDINDKIMSQLFLYGITSNSIEFSFKNKIIENALNLEWLNSINKEDAYFLGLIQYSKKNYKIAIDLFKESLKLASNSKDLDNINYFIGLSYFQLNNYKDAKNYFSLEYKKENKQTYYDSKTYLGLTEISLNETKEGIKHLNYVYENSESYTIAYKNCLLNLAIQINKPNDSLKILLKLDEVIESIVEGDDTQNNNLNELKSLSYYFKSSYYKAIGDNENAKDFILKSYLLAKNNHKLMIVDHIFNNYNDIEKESISEIINSVIRILIDGQYSLNDNNQFLNLNDTIIYNLISKLNVDITAISNTLSKKINISQENIIYNIYIIIENKLKFFNEHKDSLIEYSNINTRIILINYIIKNNQTNYSKDILLENLNSLLKINIPNEYFISFYSIILSISIKSYNNKDYYYSLFLINHLENNIDKYYNNLEFKIYIYYWKIRIFSEMNSVNQLNVNLDILRKVIREIEKSNNYFEFKKHTLPIIKNQIT